MEVTKVAEIEEKSAEAAVDSESVVAEDTEDVGPGQHLFGEPLEMYLLREPKLAVAFSGGCDSALLLAAAKLAGCEVRAYLVKTAFQPDFELDDARAVAAALDVPLTVVEADVLAQEAICANPADRCYLCKHELFEKIWEIARENGMNAVAEGSNMDDNGDYRPGLIAVKELGVSSPLRQAELYKEEIRELSKKMGLPTWDKQSFACLSSRFVYGETISEKKLGMVDKAEQLLLDMGFHQVRVRIHGNIARIEVLPDEITKIVEEGNRTKIANQLKEYGFDYVTLDLLGYRTGSMYETLDEKEKEI